MASEVEIINGALSKLGEQPILAITDPSPAGRLANRTYADIRDAMLREYPWNFAVKRASLAAEVDVPLWEFALSYVLPPDCLRLIAVNNPGDLEWRNEGGRIVTDIAAPLEIKYVALVLVGSFDATFREALSARLAMEWAEPLAQTTSVSSAMANLYQNKLRVARVADGQEDRQQVIEAVGFIEARF